MVWLCLGLVSRPEHGGIAAIRQGASSRNRLSARCGQAHGPRVPQLSCGLGNRELRLEPTGAGAEGKSVGLGSALAPGDERRDGRYTVGEQLHGLAVRELPRTEDVGDPLAAGGPAPSSSSPNGSAEVGPLLPATSGAMTPSPSPKRSLNSPLTALRVSSPRRRGARGDRRRR